MASARARRAIVNSLKNLSADINDVLDNFEESKVMELTGMKSMLQDKIKRFVEISEEISTTIEDDEEFDKFTDETYQQQVKYRQILNKIEFTLK